MHNKYEFNKENTNLKIILVDRYFSMYRVVTDSIEIFNTHSLGDRQTLNDFKKSMYKELEELKNSAAFPLELNISYIDKDFVLKS